VINIYPLVMSYTAGNYNWMHKYYFLFKKFQGEKKSGQHISYLFLFSEK